MSDIIDVSYDGSSVKVIEYKDCSPELQKILDKFDEDAKNGFKDYVRRGRLVRRVSEPTEIV